MGRRMIPSPLKRSRQAVPNRNECGGFEFRLGSDYCMGAKGDRSVRGSSGSVFEEGMMGKHLRFGISCAAGILLAVFTTVPASVQAQRTETAQPTFTKDVVPILQRSCQDCHRPGSLAPMSLLTYEDARPWARSIKTRVAAREMPPWFIDRHIGIRKFKNDISLSDQEIAKIVGWVDAGAPKGNPADLPPVRQFPEITAWQT